MLITSRVDLFKKISDLSSAYLRINNTEDLTNEVIKFLQAIIEVEYSSLYFIDELGKLKLHWSKSLTDKEKLNAEYTAMDRYPGQVLKTKQLLYIPHGQDSNLSLEAILESKLSIGSAIYVPILDKEKCIGVFAIISSKKNRFSELDIGVLTFVANITGALYSYLANKERINQYTKEIEFLATIPSQNPFPILRLDYSGKLIYANKSSQDLLLERHCNIGDEIKGEFLEIFEKAMQQNKRLETEYSTSSSIYSLTFVPVPDMNYLNVYGRDITARKKIEDELRKASLIAREIDDGVVITDPSGLIEWVNAGFERMTGYKESELIGKSPGQVLQGANTDPDTVSKIADALSKRTPIETEILNYRKNGEEYWVRILIQPVFNESHDLTNFISIQQDITINRKLEEDLSESEKITKMIIDTALDAVIMIDQNGMVIDWNTQAEVTFSWKKEDVVGKSLNQLIIPKKYVQAHKDGMKKYLEDGTGPVLNKRIEITAIRRSGEEFPVELTITPLHLKNRIIFSAFVRDITEKQLAQKSLEQTTSRLINLIQNMHEGILVEDEQRNIVLANQTFCEMFEIPFPSNTLVGLDCGKLAEDGKANIRNGDDFIKRIEELLEDKVQVIGEEIELKNGKVLERDFIPINSGEKFNGILWKYDDVTHRKQFEMDLHEARKRAESADAAKSIFLAKMSHEIRTPMNAIIGMARLLEDTSLETGQKKIVQNLNSSSYNLLRIVNEILDYSKLDSGKATLEITAYNLNEFMLGIYEIFLPSVKEKSIEFKMDLDPKCNKFYLGDQYKTQQILFNLINNSVKFTTKGIITISCQVLNEHPDHDEVMFTIWDTGIGIDKEKLNSIFEVFTQEDESVSRKYGGTGLGLSITKQLIELMGGKMEVDSEKGKGFRFSFTLELPRAEDPVKNRLSTKMAVRDDLLRSVNILLVEDNDFNQFYALTVLEKYKANVTIAENGEVAIRILREKSFDIVLVDLEMPVMDGYAVTRIARTELGLKIPFIVLTANIMEEFIQMAIDSGANDFLIKPFEPEELINKISQNLQLEDETRISTSKVDAVPVTRTYHNLNNLRKALGNDEVVMKTMVRKFIEVVPGYIADLVNAADSGDIEDISKISHKIKSSIDLLASDELKSLMFKINDYSKNRVNMAELPKLIKLFSEGFGFLVSQLKLFLE